LKTTIDNRTDMKVLELIQNRLIFVTGKGGVGKTCLSASLGQLSADIGHKTLIVEVDNFHPSLSPIFSTENKYHPQTVRRNLDICNCTWPAALEDWLVHTIKIRSIVNLVLSNKIAMLFLNATPGAREIVILSKIIHQLDFYDKVIVDLPASGHAFGILRVPTTAISLMRTGPIHDRAKQINAVFSSNKAAIVLSSLPEEMVVNETIEFYDKIRNEIPQFQNITVFLNRTAVPSFSKEEAQLLQQLKEEQAKHPEWKEYIQAGSWDKELEESTTRAIGRLEEKLGYSIFTFARLGLLGGFEGGIRKVVEQMTSSLNRRIQKEASQQ